MRSKRLLNGAFWLVMAPLLVAAVFVLAAVILLILSAFGFVALVKLCWNSLPRHRRALALARSLFATEYPQRVASDWHVCRRRRTRCFVRAQLAGISQPATYWLCAVGDSGQIDDLGTWQFRHGIGCRHAVRAYESAKTAGADWPTGLAQLLQTVPAKQLPSAAQPGLHPHEGSVLVLADKRITLYAAAETANVLLDSSSEVMAFDSDFRRLYFARLKANQEPQILAPIPPTPRDKAFMEELRHYLITQSAEGEREALRAMTPHELIEYGLQHLGELDGAEEVIDGEFE